MKNAGRIEAKCHIGRDAMAISKPRVSLVNMLLWTSSSERGVLAVVREARKRTAQRRSREAIVAVD